MRLAMSSTDITRTRAAASSTASGNPSSGAQTARTASGGSSTSGRAARARSTNNSADAVEPRPGNGYTASDDRPSGARLVVFTAFDPGGSAIYRALRGRFALYNELVRTSARAHGATVGELDRNALFYLESRGVTPEEAKALLTRAFVADVIDRIGEAKVCEAFHADGMAWLGGVQ